MMYQVKWKQDLQELIDILQEEGFTLQVESPQSFFMKKESEERFEVFGDILAYFVGYSALRKLLESELLKKGLVKEEVITLTETTVYDLNISNYFFVLTKILIKEYLKSMDVFNMDSFMLFNMKGLKEEVKSLAEHLHTHNIEKSSEDGEPFNNVDDLYTILTNRLIENGVDVQEFNEIHVSQQGDYLHFKNKQGTLIDQDFFEEYMGSILEFEIPESTENPEVLEGIMVSSVLVQIFDVSKIVLHSSLPDKSKELLHYNFTAIKKETGKRIKVVDCNGCIHCQ